VPPENSSAANLPFGLFDAVITDSLARQLSALPADCDAVIEDIPATASHADLTAKVSQQLTALLDELEGTPDEKVRRQVEILNALLREARQHHALPVDFLQQPAKSLKAIKQQGEAAASPLTGLAHPWLFTAAKGTQIS
jgi:hypothetical protein